MADVGVEPARTDRRGDATRENMLEAALKALPTGDPADRVGEWDRQAGPGHLGCVPIRRLGAHRLRGSNPDRLSALGLGAVVLGDNGF